MVETVARRTPNTGNTKFTTTAVDVIEGTIDLPPSVTAPHVNMPTFCFGIAQCCFDVLIGVLGSRHDTGEAIFNLMGCQMTTIRWEFWLPFGKTKEERARSSIQAGSRQQRRIIDSHNHKHRSG